LSSQAPFFEPGHSNGGPPESWYTTAEVGKLLNKSEYTVREWCRQRRVRATKRACGWGDSKDWIVSHEELTRLRNEGLLPDAVQAKS
jgi:hypothetical protein